MVILITFAESHLKIAESVSKSQPNQNFYDG
jgi:hypothetical protein